MPNDVVMWNNVAIPSTLCVESTGFMKSTGGASLPDEPEVFPILQEHEPAGLSSAGCMLPAG